MSNNEETWQPRTPTDGEYNFEGWLYWETKLGYSDYSLDESDDDSDE